MSLLINKYLHTRLENSNYVMSVMKILHNEGRYEVYVSKKENPYKYIYSCGKAKEDTVFRIAKKYNLEIK